MASSTLISNFVLSAGGVLIDKSRGLVCLIKSAKQEYLLPKGRKESSESLAVAAEREIFEETGYRNTVFADRLLGVLVRPQVGGVHGEHKIVFWYYSELQSDRKHCDTQDEGEDFTSEWFTEEEAMTKIGFAEDKLLVQYAFQFSTEVQPHRLGAQLPLKYGGPDNSCVRVLIDIPTQINCGYVIFQNGQICHKLSSGADDDADVQTYKKQTECQTPFLYELFMCGGSQYDIRSWFLIVQDSESYTSSTCEETVQRTKDETMTFILQAAFDVYQKTASK